MSQLCHADHDPSVAATALKALDGTIPTSLQQLQPEAALQEVFTQIIAAVMRCLNENNTHSRDWFDSSGKM